MKFNKTTNDFGIFGNIMALQNDVVVSVSATKAETEKEAVKIAANITGDAVHESVEDGDITRVEGLMMAIGAVKSTQITLITPDKEDIKAFVAAVVKTAKDGDMSHMKDYVKESGNDVPQDIWDYIFELTNKH